MRKALMAGAAAVGLMMMSQAANADYLFSGSGSSGTLVAPSETWMVGSANPPTGDFGWGSPGVNAGTTAYGEAVPATNFEITFSGDVLDAAQIAIGNAANCGGTDTGGTTFCGGDFSAGPWTAVLQSPSSIAFFAPPGVNLAQGELYFVNIFLAGTAHPVSFTGRWSVPEPASLALLGAALAGFGLMRRRKSA